MIPALRRLIVMIGAVAVIAGAAALYPRLQEQAPGALTDGSLQPQAVLLLPEGNDPRVIEIGVIWTEPGWCIGQFDVKATETATEVRVGPVAGHVNANDMCAGVGTANNMAWAELRLASPLGTRRVTRASDGMALRVLLD
jgi:hypothetical protein